MIKAKMIATMIPEVYHGYCLRIVQEALTLFPKHLLQIAMDANVKIIPVMTTFSNVSPLIKKTASFIDDVKNCQGLFVVDEKTVYIKQFNKGTIVHEFAHALDLATGFQKGYQGYNSFTDRNVQYAWNCNGFVNVYSASRIDEFFAELVRAYLDIDDMECLPANKKLLMQKNPFMFDYLKDLFSVKKVAIA